MICNLWPKFHVSLIFVSRVMTCDIHKGSDGDASMIEMSQRVLAVNFFRKLALS